MNGYSNYLLIFALPIVCDGRHRGELQSFEPSENLENSMKPEEQCQTCLSIALANEFRLRQNSKGFCLWQSLYAWVRRLRAVPPVVNICTPFPGALYYIPMGVSRFHSYMHRYSRTF